MLIAKLKKIKKIINQKLNLGIFCPICGDLCYHCNQLKKSEKSNDRNTKY